MKTKKIRYQVTIGYKAVLTVDVKAENEEQAKKLAIEEFKQYRHFGRNIEINDDSFAAHGILNMDETWRTL